MILCLPIKMVATLAATLPNIWSLASTRYQDLSDCFIARAGVLKPGFSTGDVVDAMKGAISSGGDLAPAVSPYINIVPEESEDEVLVDLSSQYLTGGGSAAVQLKYLQIYKTLKKICPSKDIYLNVEGKSLKTIGGEGLEVTQPITKINDYTQKYEKTKDVQP